MKEKLGAVIFGVRFTLAQEAALAADSRSPRWDLHPPQREEYDDDHAYAVGLRDYCDRLIAANNAVRGAAEPRTLDGLVGGLNQEDKA
jgi:hypothetical protein